MRALQLPIKPAFIEDPSYIAWRKFFPKVYQPHAPPVDCKEPGVEMETKEVCRKGNSIDC